VQQVDQFAAQDDLSRRFVDAGPGPAATGQAAANSLRNFAVGKRQEQPAPAGAGLELRAYESLESAEELRGEWEALLEEYPYSTTFSTWEWLASWWRAYARNDQPLILAFRDSSGSLIAVAPLGLTIRRVAGVNLRSLRLIGDGSYDSDNLDLPVRPGSEAAFSRALLDWLLRHAPPWDICRLRTLPAHSPMGQQLLRDLRAGDWKTHASTVPQSLVELPGSWDAYLKGLSSKERGKIGLRTRRLEKKYRVRIRKCVEEAELDVALDTLFELHGKLWQSRGSTGAFQVPARRQFYREMAPLLLSRQRLEFWLLQLDERVVAVQFALRHGATVYSLQEGFDPDYSSDSVGYVLRGHVLRDLIGRGIRQYDFLGGVEQSKLRWGARAKDYLTSEFARPRNFGSLLLPVERTLAGMKTWLRASLPHPVLRTLNRLRGQRQVE